MNKFYFRRMHLALLSLTTLILAFVFGLPANMDPAGHGGASGRYDRLHETAFDYAYFLTQMGITN